MADPRHIAHPFRFGATGQIATVAQDSDDDIAGCIANILAYPQGSRPEMPDFGMPADDFRAGGVALEAIRATLQTYEPRANVHLLSDDELVNLVQTVTVGFQPNG